MDILLIPKPLESKGCFFPPLSIMNFSQDLIPFDINKQPKIFHVSDQLMFFLSVFFFFFFKISVLHMIESGNHQAKVYRNPQMKI